MLRGVNRQIIEVNETGHPYFERAFLVVRTDCQETDPGEGLANEARRFVDSATAHRGLKLSRVCFRFSHLLAVVAGMGGGVLLSLLWR